MPTDTPLVVVDADALIALTFAGDAKHAEALRVSRKLEDLQARLIYPVTAVSEAVTFIQRVLGSSATAFAVAETLAEPGAGLVGVDAALYEAAVRSYFSPLSSKKNTLFDCIIAAVARSYSAAAIFSFDRFYRARGFKLASQL